METAAVPQSAPSRRRSTLRRLSIHLWALTHIAIAWSNFLSRLRISKDPPALARNTAQLVRTLLAVGEALADQPAPGAPGSWRRAVWLHFRVHYFTHIVSGATAVAHQYSSELTADQLQRVIRLGSLALEYFEQGAKRFLEVPAQSWRQALMPSMQKNFLRMKRATRQTALHCNLAWAYVRLDVGDLARNHDTAFKHYELAAQTLERENIPGLFLSAATVWTKLATALLEYPTEHQRAHAERARDLLIKTRQILSRYRRPGATSPLIVGRHPRFFSLVRIAWGGAKLEVTGAADPSIVDALGPFFEVRVAEELGRAYLRLSDFRKACEEFDLALDQEKHLRGDPAIGRIHLQKALAYLERPDGDRRKNLLTAAKEAGTAIDQTGKGISVVPYVRALITDAQICLELDSSGLVQVDHRANMYGKVGNNLRIGARLARGAGLYFLLRETCFCLGKVYFRQNDIPNAYRALALAARVSDRLERTVRTPRLHRYWSGLGTPLYTLLVRAAYECTNVLDRDSNRYRVVLRSGLLYAERGRTVLLRSEIAKQNLIPRGADRHDVERLFSLRKNWHASELTLIELESAGQVNPTERVGLPMRRDSLEKEYLTELEAVRTRYNDAYYDPDRPLRSLGYGDILDLVQSLSVREDTAFVEYFLGQSWLRVFVVVPRRDGSPYTLFAGTSSVKRKDLEELANEWEEWRERSRLVHPLHWERGFLLPTVNRFRQLAMAPSRAIAKWEQATNRRIRRVVVVPHRALHLLPFHLLPLEDGHAWGELYSTHYTPSLSLLSRLKTELSSSNAHTNASIVAYGPAQQRLPFLAAEARAVQETTGGTLVEGQDATPARVTRSIEDASYVHFACHATFVRETPMEAALLLAPDEASNSSGRLTLGNIVERLHFSQAPLVVLSACETGLSKIEDLHDEYIGLPAGFLYAGARTVISSLWPVSDLATWLLMSSMVRRLVACGEPPATALLHAQAEFRSLTYSEIETRVNTLAETIVDPSQREAMQSELAYLRMAWAERPFSSPYWWAGFTVNGLAID